MPRPLGLPGDLLDADQVRVWLRARAHAAGGVRPLARQLGVSAPYVSHVLEGHQAPGRLLCGALGLERQVRYYVIPPPTDGGTT